jgi:hypothetical protein
LAFGLLATLSLTGGIFFIAFSPFRFISSHPLFCTPSVL